MPGRSDSSTNGELLQQLTELQHLAEKRALANADPAFPAESDELVGRLRQLVDSLGGGNASSFSFSIGADSRDVPPAAAPATSRGLSAADLTILRDHVINLNAGQFSQDDKYSTRSEDVDRIFGQSLPEWVKQLGDKKPNVVFWAHGGLTDEAAGLNLALQHIPWWKENGVYPIYFVWQTGFWQTVSNLLHGIQQRSVAIGARDFFDYSSDPALEGVARLLGGPLIWGGMKRSAELASNPGSDGVPAGGAYYVAQRLAEFLKSGRSNSAEVHAIGHSAGSIFHAYFVPAALKAGVGNFKTLQFLAPAIRVDTFKLTLYSIVKDGPGVGKLVMYSMKEPFEKADNCDNLYHKSLLYLIFYALEDKRKTPILGLEECVWQDPELKALFGLGGGEAKAEAIWSETPITTGLNACRSLSHGGFDDDASTMCSALRHVLAVDDSVEIKPSSAFVQGGRSIELKQPAIATKLIAAAVSDDSAPQLPIFQPGATNLALAGGGQRRAICVGINAYPGANQLYGCVPDAQLWARTFGSLGFQTQLILDANATYDRLVSALKSMISSSKRGDVIVFQYSGHGTSIPHEGGQEPDEAMVPFDFFTTGALLVDKELATIFSSLPDGVNLTCFFDCCHSGDLDRLLLSGTTTRARFIHLTSSQLALYNQFAGKRALRLLPKKSTGTAQRDISFAACSRSESAMETNGQGDFTGRATELIRKLTGTVSNSQFKGSVVAAFGPGARQHPELDGATAFFESAFLQPIDVSPAKPAATRVEDQPATVTASSTAQLIAKTLRAVADQLDASN